MLNNLLNFRNKKRTRRDKRVSDIQHKLSPDAKEFNSDDFFFRDDDREHHFIAKALNDYKDIKTGDYLIIRVNCSPLSSDYIAHECGETGDILKYADYNPKTDGEILGVVTRIIRRIEL